MLSSAVSCLMDNASTSHWAASARLGTVSMSHETNPRSVLKASSVIVSRTRLRLRSQGRTTAGGVNVRREGIGQRARSVMLHVHCKQPCGFVIGENTARVTRQSTTSRLRWPRAQSTGCAGLWDGGRRGLRLGRRCCRASLQPRRGWAWCEVVDAKRDDVAAWGNGRARQRLVGNWPAGTV